MIAPETFRSEELNAVNAKNALSFKKVLLAIDNTATQRQREKLITEINKYARKVGSLIQN
jgi:hypothetical protein